MNPNPFSPSVLVAALLVSLSACAKSPVVVSQIAAKQQVEVSSTAQPASQLTSQLMYQFLLGEIAGQRGELKLAAEAYADLAIRTRDARVAKRATEVALYARQNSLALRNAQLWQELEPGSVKAQQTLASLLVGGGRLSEAKPYLESWLKTGKPEQVFMQLHGLFSRLTDKQGVASLVSGLAAAYPALPESRYALAQATWQAGQGGKAVSAIDEALRLKPGWQLAALFKAQVLQQKENDEAAIASMADFLQQFPQADEVRTAYARQLARTGRMDDAKASFELLIKQSPSNPEPHFALGLVAMQGNELDAALTSFKRALELGYEDESTLYYLMGQVAEAKGDLDSAMTAFRAVTGRQQMDAHLRLSMVLAKAGRLQEARDWLAKMRDVRGLTGEDDGKIAQTEAQLLRDAKLYVEAFDVLDKALSRNPNGLELLYDRAMAAERLDRLDVLEQDLRHMIQLKPDYAHAYNALGYTLADRTTRLAEAVDLLQKAINLAPDDPFILDSMGWALFKSKRYDESADYLRRAYRSRPDPDIAAHLGEVLWTKGERDEARKIWQSGLKSHPDNESLRETVSRLAP